MNLCGLSVFLKAVSNHVLGLVGDERCFQRGQLLVKDRKLVVNEAEAAIVRMIFERFVRVGSATTLARSLAAEGVLTKRGRPIDRGYL